VVYDCMDELSAFKDAPRQLRQRETALLKLASVVFTGGLSLYDAKRNLHDNVHCLPSAVDAQHFSPETLDHESEEALEAERLQAHIGHPRLGFFGVIDERFDIELLRTVAKARPGWQFIMAGPVVKIEPANLPHAPNIHWLGMQPYGRLPHLIASWDVCLMPFALNAATRYISPTKTLEYMAAEKPIVSTAVHDVKTLYGDLVRIAEDSKSFLAACEDLLSESEPEREQRVRQMLGRVWHSSWDRAAETVRELLGESLQKVNASPATLRELAGLAPQVGTLADAASISQSGGRAPRQVRHLIIGAGPTGLSAAYHLGLQPNGTDTLLVEREERVGGWCRSVQQDGFTFDYAGHIMFSNDPHVLELYDLLLGDNLHWQNREAWIYSKSVYTRYPFQGSLYGLPPKVLKECLVGAIEARFGSLKGNGSSETPQPPANFEEFIYKVWGSGIAKHFAIPYNEKLWAVPLDSMETSWLGGRVPLPDLEQMIEGALEPTPPPMGPNARFGYPLKGGFQALMDAFLPHLKCDLALNTSVLHVSPSRRLVRLDDGRIMRFESLISTMPLPQLVEACGDEAPDEIRAAAKALRHVSVRCVNLGIGRENITEKHWIYYPEDTVFHRIFVQGNASPHCNPPGGFGLTCEITYGPSKPLPCDGQALIERCIADCRKVGIIREDDPVIAANQVDLPCAYVVYDHSRAANVDLIRNWFASFGITLAGRYSEWEYYNSDHAFIAGQKAAEEAMANAAQPRVASAG
ncbi:MAG: FAD-dependent oxidoreductase, partial [Betaproteobacteria bacterium]